MYLALLQTVPADNVSDGIGQIVTAFQAHNYVLLAALVAYFGVSVTKQGWLGNKIASLIPSAALPWYAMGLGFVTTTSAELIAGVALQKAALDGLSGLVGAALAVLSHETVVEHLRGGREIVPQAPWAKPPAAPPPPPPPSSTGAIQTT